MMIYLILIIFLSIFIGEETKIPFNQDSFIIYEGSHPAHKWEGLSNDIRGGIVCVDNECIIQVIIPLESFDSGNSGRDSNMLFSTESHKYPYVKYYSEPFLIEIINNTKWPSGVFPGNEKSMDLSGYIEFHGVKKKIQSDITINYQDSVLLGVSDFYISLDDYRIKKPQLLFIPISDQIRLRCSLYCNNIFSKL